MFRMEKMSVYLFTHSQIADQNIAHQNTYTLQQLDKNKLAARFSQLVLKLSLLLIKIKG